MEQFIAQYKGILYPVAEIIALTLELVGIIIIVAGSVRALIRLLQSMRNKTPFRMVVVLGKPLSLALEFKMGAEIINTAIVHNLEELSILGVVILIRALLAFIIRWEIRNEEKRAALNKNTSAQKEDNK